MLTDILKGLAGVFVILAGLTLLAVIGVFVLFIGYFMLWGVLGLFIVWVIWFLIWAFIQEMKEPKDSDDPGP